MKKIYVAMAVLGTVLFSSCVREKNFDDKKIKVGENELAFVMEGVATRSGEEAVTAERGVTIPMGVVKGEGLYLEESIEYLNPGPATKGAPAYTVTLPDVYPTLGVYAAGKFGDVAFALYDTEMYKNKGWRYNHSYNGSPWPDSDTEPVDFYLRMPSSGGGVTLGEDKTTFELTSPLNGQEQKDLLFGQVTMSKKEHDAQLPGGMPVQMKHALSGIKFRNGHLNGTQTKTVITKVELIGLNMYGKGTIGEDGVVTWDASATPVLSTEDAPFYLTFDNDATYNTADGASSPDGTVTAWDEKLAGTSWNGEKAAADHNLNHSNGDLTFWFVPQEVPDDLILKLEFTVKTPDTPNGTELPPHVIELGSLLNTKYQSVAGNEGKKLMWGAGELRTYTLKPYDVDVEIVDTVDETVKSNLHVANTGNVDEYVRILIMGNWYGWKTAEEMAANPDNPSILIGYKYKDAASTPSGHDVNEMVDPWFRSGDNGTDPYGTFDSSFLLANLGERDGDPYDWADASGGFYFTMPIGPGDGVHSAESATKDLFESYTVTNVPDIYLPVGNTREKAVGVHLVMEIVIQAIAVPTYTAADGTTKNVWWLQAWYEATGVSKLNPALDRNEKYRVRYEAGEYDPE